MDTGHREDVHLELVAGPAAVRACVLLPSLSTLPQPRQHTCHAALLSLALEHTDRDVLCVICFVALCLEKFSAVRRYHKKLWHDLALNGGIQPLKALLRSTLLSSPWERARTAINSVFSNLGIDTSDLGITIEPSSYNTVLSLLPSIRRGILTALPTGRTCEGSLIAMTCSPTVSLPSRRLAQVQIRCTIEILLSAVRI